GHAYLVLLLEDVLHIHARHGQAFGGDVMISLGGGVAVGVVEDYGPGAATEAARPHQLRRFAQTGAKCRSRNACMAAMSASKSTPSGVAAQLKQAIVGTGVGDGGRGMACC